MYVVSGAAPHQLSSIFLLQLWKKTKTECNKLARVELAQIILCHSLALQFLAGWGKKRKDLPDFLLCEGDSLEEQALHYLPGVMSSWKPRQTCDAGNSKRSDHHSHHLGLQSILLEGNKEFLF